MTDQTALTPAKLRTSCDPSEFSFATTNDLEDLTDMVGQARAIEAVEFGIGIDKPGFNLFVLGPAGTGRHSFVKRFLSARAKGKDTPPDWCYVNNFDQPRMPIALELPAGRGRQFCADLERLVDEAYVAIPTAFESEEYRESRKNIEEGFSREQAKRFQDLQRQASTNGIAIIRTPQGFAFAPLKDGKPMPPEDIEALPDAEKQRLEKSAEELTEKVQDTMSTMPRLVRDVRAQIHELDRQVAMLAAGSLIDELLQRYGDLPKVATYLQSLQSDLIDNFALFLMSPDAQAEASGMPPQMMTTRPGTSPAKKRYCANLLVDNSAVKGLPVIAEDHPNYPNLVGEIEYLAHMGALETDFSLIHDGALHRANGGFLIVDALKVLSEPYAWQGLKQALKAQCIRIESLGKSMGLVQTASLEPEPIPLDVKVVLIGDRMTYYQLQALDPEFTEHFKVAADFDDRMTRSPENNLLFARLLGTTARQEGLLPLDPSGVARLIDESARHAGHAGKLSAQVRRAVDIMREANFWAEKDADGRVDAHDVQRAIDMRIRRAARVRDRLQEDIIEGTTYINTDGEAVGQINGLAVLQIGDFAFAKPSRITARVGLGTGKVIDIERESELGGPLHSKGMMILSGLLAASYAADVPLSLSASIVMEQSYGGVDGDSASTAELLALLSAIGKLPLKQSLAITGSINQYGEVQPIGGVNAKIEGFFDICNQRGLTGMQGVVIPASNVKHLMLRQDVVDAVEGGTFAVHAVSHLHEALTLFTGMPAGEADTSGAYPDGTANAAVRARLIEFAERRRDFARSGNGNSDKADPS